jgi:(2Fe-2S) ferredoxin
VEDPPVFPPTGDGRRFIRHAFVCTNKESCALDGSEAVQAHLKARLKEAGLKESLRINKSGCLGQCGHGPMMVVYPEGVWYCHLTLADAERIWQEHMLDGRPVEELMYRTDKAGTNVIPKKGGPVSPENPINTASPFWSPCSRCPAEWPRQNR